MTWIKLSDNFFNDPRVVSLSKDGKLMYLAAMCYAGHNLTDGLIPRNAVTILAAQAGVTAWRQTITNLVIAGLLTKAADDWEIVGYLDIQTPAATVHQRQQKARERMQQLRSGDVRANGSRTDDERSTNHQRTSPDVLDTEPRLQRSSTLSDQHEVESLAADAGTADAPGPQAPAPTPAGPSREDGSDGGPIAPSSTSGEDRDPAPGPPANVVPPVQVGGGEGTVAQARPARASARPTDDSSDSEPPPPMTRPRVPNAIRSVAGEVGLHDDATYAAYEAFRRFWSATGRPPAEHDAAWRRWCEETVRRREPVAAIVVETVEVA